MATVRIYRCVVEALHSSYQLRWTGFCQRRDWEFIYITRVAGNKRIPIRSSYDAGCG